MYMYMCISRSIVIIYLNFIVINTNSCKQEEKKKNTFCVFKYT